MQPAPGDCEGRKFMHVPRPTPNIAGVVSFGMLSLTILPCGAPAAAADRAHRAAAGPPLPEQLCGRDAPLEHRPDGQHGAAGHGGRGGGAEGLRPRGL
eukprot:scaffold465214_cov39-Prasinocladus_malaysianus.AAC.1